MTRPPFPSRVAPVLLLALVVLLGGCRLDVRVDVRADEDGRGTVRVVAELDEAAAREIGGPAELRFDDLVAAGWVVEAPVSLEGGGFRLAASKPFGSPAQLRDVLVEISGPDGPYADLGLEIDRPFARTELRLTGRLDGSVGVEAFFDPEVAALLGGLPLGRPLDEIEAEIGAPVGTAVGLELGVVLPGGLDRADGADPTGSALAPDPVAGPPDAVWRTDLAAEAPVEVAARSEVRRWGPVALVATAAALLGLAGLVLLLALAVGVRRRRRRRRARRLAEAPTGPSPSPPRATPARSAPEAGAGAVEDPAPAAGDGPPPLRLVILGAPGVVFGVGDMVAERLLPFVRARGGELPDAEIAEAYSAAATGRTDTAAMWAAVGLDADPAVLDEELLGSFQLAPGVREFAARAADRGFTVAAIVDAPASWADTLRTVFHLDGVLDPWVTSAAIGVRPPHAGLLEAVRRGAGVPVGSCLVIDTSLDTLEMALDVGFGTAWCTPTGRAADAPEHEIVRGLEGLLGG